MAKTQTRKVSKKSSRKGTMKVGAATKKVITKIAKQAVRTNVETKYVAQASDGFQSIWASPQPTGAGALLQLFGACPPMAQGVAEYQRTGTKVRPVKCSTDMIFTFNNRAADLTGQLPQADAWDLTVHVWYGFVRKYKSMDGISADAVNILGNLFDSGTGATWPFQGRQLDLIQQINKEYFNIKHTSFRMYKSAGTANLATSTGAGTDQFQPSIQCVKKRLNFALPATLLYNEANALPENYAPIFIVGYAHNDASQGANVVTTPPGNVLYVPAIQMAYQTNLWFKDA